MMLLASASALLSGLSGPPGLPDDSAGIRGAWRAQSYALKDGTKHEVDGLIFFSSEDWLVLFFVMEDGEPRRGSGEGGRYELSGEALTFFHQYHFSRAEAVSGLPESALKMEVREASEAPDEPCTVKVSGAELTLYFPSGNSMQFSRSSD